MTYLTNINHLIGNITQKLHNVNHLIEIVCIQQASDGSGRMQKGPDSQLVEGLLFFYLVCLATQCGN